MPMMRMSQSPTSNPRKVIRFARVIISDMPPTGEEGDLEPWAKRSASQARERAHPFRGISFGPAGSSSALSYHRALPCW